MRANYSPDTARALLRTVYLMADTDAEFRALVQSFLLRNGHEDVCPAGGQHEVVGALISYLPLIGHVETSKRVCAKCGLEDLWIHEEGLDEPRAE